jgi:hypothetical protein
MIEKIIMREELNYNNCFFVPQAGFAYSKFGEKKLVTFYIYSCLGIYLKQGNVQILAHIDSNPKKNLFEMLNYLHKKEVIKNNSFDEVKLIIGLQSSINNYKKSLEFLKPFVKNIDIISKNYSPVNFGFDELGKFYNVIKVKNKLFSFDEFLSILVRRFSQKSLICENEKLEI